MPIDQTDRQLSLSMRLKQELFHHCHQKISSNHLHQAPSSLQQSTPSSHSGKIVQCSVQKLNNRGKKILPFKFSTIPDLPKGFYGPHTIGAFSHLQKLQHQYKPTIRT